MDRMCERVAKALFIQRCWRGFAVRKQVRIVVDLKQVKQMQMKRGVHILAHALEIVFERAKKQQPCAQAIRTLRLNSWCKKYSEMRHCEPEAVKIQRAVR